MIFLIRTYDPEREDGWYVSKESENLNDFDRDEQYWFKLILKGKRDFTHGRTGYVEDGNAMFTIEYD